MEKVTFKCPECGQEWVELQDPKDEWFKLATKQCLCDKCTKKAIIKVITNDWELSSNHIMRKYEI